MQSDFLEKITRARPIQALAELIWNSLDADASQIEVLEDNDLGVMSRIIVRDNGTGIEHRRAPELFGSLGGSWKRSGATTTEGRFLHGQDGRGRFKVFSLGRFAEWDVTFQKEGRLSSFTVTMAETKLKEEQFPRGGRGSGTPRGVTPTISELHKDFRSFTSSLTAACRS